MKYSIHSDAVQRGILVTFLGLVSVSTILYVSRTASPKESDASCISSEEAVSPTAPVTGTLKDAVTQAVFAHYAEKLPSDYGTACWTLLGQAERNQQLTVYILTFYDGKSGSPAIFDHGEISRITCVESLPAVLNFQIGADLPYQLDTYWEPSQERYAEDVRENFPTEVAESILQDWTGLQQKLAEDHEQIRDMETDGPVWGAYQFDVDDAFLCYLVDYYGESDIYTVPIRNELKRRFKDAPIELLNALGQCEDERQCKVSAVLLTFREDPEFAAALEKAKANDTQLSEQGRALRILLSDNP